MMLRKIALGALFALPFMAIAQVSNPGVSSINGQRGAFTFTGAVTCTLMTCNFTGGGGGGGPGPARTDLPEPPNP